MFLLQIEVIIIESENIFITLAFFFWIKSTGTVCCLCVCSVLQHIPQYSPECDDSSGVTMELPVKAGLAVLKVSHHCTDLNVFFIYLFIYF